MFRKVITNGDLVLTYKPWYSLGIHTPYRNLSEEVRDLHGLEKKAKAKHSELARLLEIASANVEEDLLVLTSHLLSNSTAYFETELNNSILEEREDVRYKFNRSNNGKQGQASSNKDKQKANQEKQKQQQNSSRNGGNGITVGQLLSMKLVGPKQ